MLFKFFKEGETLRKGLPFIAFLILSAEMNSFSKVKMSIFVKNFFQIS